MVTAFVIVTALVSLSFVTAKPWKKVYRNAWHMAVHSADTDWENEWMNKWMNVLPSLLAGEVSDAYLILCSMAVRGHRRCPVWFRWNGKRVWMNKGIKNGWLNRRLNKYLDYWAANRGKHKPCQTSEFLKKGKTYLKQVRNILDVRRNLLKFCCYWWW